MNTETPRTNEWETYCDECYYHMWRVRRKNERGFDDGFHVQNGEGARQLVELLNKQDEELTTVTEQRDELLRYNEAFRKETLICADCDAIRKEEYDQAIEQRDRLAVALEQCREDSIELLGERDWWQNEPRCDYQKRYQETRDNVTRADEALQSLTTKEL
jgi:hypothetical protein